MLSHIYIYDNTETCHNPFRNIAIEEYLTLHVPEYAVVLYLWQNEKTVVIGRNQNPYRECRVEELEAAGGHLARRLSGGGAVYHNLGNLNFTFAAPASLYDLTKQVSVIRKAASSFGIPVEQTGRNDLTTGGRKFSGNAFYRHGNRRYHHGTILISEDMKNMVRYLDTPASKLHSKKVESVPSRVVNLADLNPAVTVGAFRSAMQAAFGKVYGFTPEMICDKDLDWEEIGRREDFFASNEWRLKRNSDFTNEWEQKFPWGRIKISVKVDHGTITDAAVDSDGIYPGAVAAVPAALKGLPYGIGNIQTAIRAIPVTEEEEWDVLQDMAEMIR